MTIKDVAKKANVSPSTVSRVIANHPKISDNTKCKVLCVMEELGYYPNANAQSLASRSSNTIGVLMSRAAEKAFQNPFFPEVIGGIAGAAHENNYNVLLAVGNNSKAEVQSVKQLMRAKKVDGMIVLSSRENDLVIKELIKQKFPFVVIGRPQETGKINWVDNDNIKAAYIATKHLLDLGKRRIAFLGGKLSYTVTKDRLEGYKKALLEYNIKFQDSLIALEDFGEEGGSKAMYQVLDQVQKIDGVLITDDMMAFGALQILKDIGYEIPKDIAVVSFNNILLAQYASPPLTTVDIFVRELGKIATEILIEYLKNADFQSYKHIIVPTQLIIRNSSVGEKELIL